MSEIILDFDPADAKALKPGESIAFPEAPGLRLERSRSGWRWGYRYRSPVDDALRQIKLGDWPRMPAHRAVDAWTERRDQRNDGRDPALERRAERKAIREEPKPKTVAAIVAAHVEALGRVNPKTKAPRRNEDGQREVQRMFDFDLAPIAKRNGADITLRDAARFLSAVRDRSADIARRLRGELSAAWRTARANGLLPNEAPNPWPEALKGELAQGEGDRVLSAGEIRAVVRFLPHYGPLVADALELTLRIGLRSGEVVALRSAWFEEDDAGVLWAEIPAKFMKKRRAHRIPFVGRARAIAEARLGGEFLFPSPRPKRHIGQKALGVSIFIHRQSSETRPELERPRCPVDNWSAHDLRRTAAVLLGDIGCPFEVIEAIQARRLRSAAKVYQRSEYAAQKVEWLTKLNAHIDALAASESLRQLPRRKVVA